MGLEQAKVDILVIGGGGREHALVRALKASDRCGRILVAPGNGGTAQDAQNISLEINNAAAVAACAVAEGIGLVVIGPEEPLVNGVADAVRDAGVACFGPSAAGARIEGSKVFAKQFMNRHNLPTGSWAAFEELGPALEYLYAQPLPVVVKADGLAAGKGVTVAATYEEAETALRECLEGRFGAAGLTVIIEEALSGPECSLLAFTDGKRILPMAPAQDHKRVGEGDTGPNTGGMGVYSPVPIVTAAEHAEMLDVMQRTVDGFAGEQIDYRGVLYGGFMLTADGPQLLEFNARFGDPETQVLLPRLQSDLLEVMLKVAAGDLGDTELEWSDQWALSVVLASRGYPGSYITGYQITGIEQAEQLPGVIVYHAGTTCDVQGALVTSGGRVLNVTACADSFAAAQQLAYQAAQRIEFEGKLMRHDIGSRALRGREAWS